VHAAYQRFIFIGGQGQTLNTTNAGRLRNGDPWRIVGVDMDSLTPKKLDISGNR
jgi:hypothetical protein